MRNFVICCLAIIASACATTGPRQSSLAEALAELEAPPSGMIKAEDPETPATPFSAGLVLGAGMSLDGGHVRPIQAAAGSVRVVGKVSLLALGGVSVTSVSEAQLAWGLGAAYQLSPEPLPYRVDVATGVLWLKGEGGPVAVLGVALTPKM